MKIIIDSGSTKCDWAILDNENDLIIETETIGFNPNLVSEQFFIEKVKENKDLENFYQNSCSLYFYGAGCGKGENKNIVKKTFHFLFPNAEKIEISDDLYGASIASFTGRPAVVCILGTGSNSCLFDGKNIVKKIPSLGFLLGDEGSGFALGRKLIQKYFMNQLPDDLHKEFKNNYTLNLNDLLENIYHQPRANAYLSKFSIFIANHKNHPFFQKLINDEIEYFFENQVLPYKDTNCNHVHFIGSIALIFKEFISSIAEKHQLTLGNFIQKPIKNLVQYHQNNK